MKQKFTLIATFIFFTVLTSKAQVSKGDIIVGGNLGFTTGTQKDVDGNKNSTTNFSIQPSFGKVYKENKIIGIIARYRYLGNGDNSELNTNSYGAGIYLRQYKPLGKGFYVFVQESLNADFNHLKNFYGSPADIQDTKETNLYVTINPGFACDLSKRFQLELLFLNNLISAGYSHQTVKYEPSALYNDYKSNYFYINSNFDWSQLSSLNVGVKIFFGR